MRTRGNDRTSSRAGQRVGTVALAGLALLAVGAGTPVFAADQPAPGKGTPSASDLKNEQGGKGESAKPKPVEDVTAPQRPTLGEASTGAGGTISIGVLAESGSALVVREGTEVVASTSAVGQVQELTWRAKSGPHTYLVVATDAAGNVSEPAPLSLDVDATPPAAKGFAVKAGTDRDSRSEWAVTTQPGTTYELLVDGATVQEGTVEGRSVQGYLTLADGNHEVVLELRDEIGNLRTLTDTVAVKIPAIWVVAKDVSETNAIERSFKIAAAPGTRGFLRIPGGSSAKFELPEGRAEVTVEVEEGSYEAPIITVADTLDRKGQTTLAAFEVDQTAPAVQVEAVDAAGERGVLGALITAGEGEEVSWKLVDDRGIPTMSGEFVADGTAQLLERPVGAGDYDLEVTVTDAQGNTTVERLATSVAARPMINPDVVPALTITLVLWILVGLGFYLRRRARRLQAAGGTGVRGRGRRTRRAQLRAEQERAVAEHDELLAAFEVENRTWQQRRTELAQLVAVAGGGEVELPEAALAVDPDERVLCALPVTLVELRRHNGVDLLDEVEEGRLVVTTDRAVFTGTEGREWELGMVEQLRHLARNRTLIKVAGEETVSGVAYDDSDLVRLYLELAMAEHQGDTRSVRLMLEQGLRSHELRRPQPPTPVGPESVVAPVVEPVEQPAEQPVAPKRVLQAAPVVVAQQSEPADGQIRRELALHR